MVIASGTTSVIWFLLQTHFDSLNSLTAWPEWNTAFTQNLSLCSVTCGHACQFWILWFSCVLFHPHVFVLWLCSFFDAASPLSSACPLIWPPSAREHSADPSGKLCTLDVQCPPSPVSLCSTVPSHQGCTTLFKMACCAALWLSPLCTQVAWTQL